MAAKNPHRSDLANPGVGGYMLCHDHGHPETSAMAIQSAEIERLIREGFPDATVKITDLAGDGKHWAAEVIDESFRGQNRVQQQRAVYATLKSVMDGPSGALHALALTTKVPA
jgi:stress-induced morphogen